MLKLCCIDASFGVEALGNWSKRKRRNLIASLRCAGSSAAQLEKPQKGEGVGL